MTEKQAKLASYWNTKLNKICLGMKVNGKANWISLPYTANSFDQLIKAGHLQYSSKSSAEWLSLINGSPLQGYCDLEGFSMEMKNEFKSNSYLNVRVGFVTADDYDCLSVNSCIGFGISASCDGHPQTNTTCGNVAICGKLNNLNIDAFGYILVQ